MNLPPNLLASTGPQPNFSYGAPGTSSCQNIDRVDSSRDPGFERSLEIPLRR